MSEDHNHHHDSEATEKFEIKLINKDTVAEGTMAFSFEKPEGFNYKAGQHAEWDLINPPETDNEGTHRTFSLVSSPSEDHLTIATRMRDTAFKRVLGRMSVGDKIQVANPHGSFTLHKDPAKPAVFLIGGIGITPAISIIKDATEKNLSNQIYLFYSNHQPEDAAFLQDLENLANKNVNFKFIPTMTQLEKSSKTWQGETGYINDQMLQKYLSDIQVPIYYLSGPDKMVAAMRQVLNEAGVNDDNIKTEEFTGY